MYYHYDNGINRIYTMISPFAREAWPWPWASLRAAQFDYNLENGATPMVAHPRSMNRSARTSNRDILTKCPSGDRYAAVWP
jgi:hypothetical protein